MLIKRGSLYLLVAIVYVLDTLCKSGPTYHGN